MLDTESGQVMAQHVAALIQQRTGGAVTPDLSRIEQKLDAALAAASSTPALTHKRRADQFAANVKRASVALAGRKQRQGMDRNTGRMLTDEAHLQQSIVDILTTWVGSRVMRREYGSRVPELLDMPMTDGTLLQLYAAIADALRKWEPRFTLKRIQPLGDSLQIEERQGGQLNIKLSGDYLGRDIELGVTL